MGMNRATPAPTPAPRTLAAALRAFDDAVLGDLLRARPDIASPVPTDIAQLASRACTRASVSRALDRLDQFSLAVVEAVAALPEPVSRHDIQHILDAPAQDTIEAVETLRRLAILWGDDDSLRLVVAAAEAIGPHPAGLGSWASTLLNTYSTDRLRQLVTDLGGEPAAAKADNIALVVTTLNDSDRLEALLHDAGKAARAVLERLIWGPPVGRIEAVSAPVEALIRYGVLVATGDHTVVLPREVALHLRGQRLHSQPMHEPPPFPTTSRDPALVDRAAASAAFDLVRRTELFVDSWATDPPAVLRGGGIGVRDLRRTATLLHVDDPAAALLIEVAHEAGLVDAGDDDELDEVWLPTAAYDRWLSESPAHRWMTLVTAWLSTYRVAGLVGQRDDRDRLVNALAPDLERAAAPAVRELTLRILSEAPDGGPSQETVGAVAAWRRPRGGPLRDELVAWALQEAAVLGITALGTISSFGRVLLNDPAALTSMLEPLLPATIDHVLLQADLTAVAPGPLDTDLSSRLAACADVESRGGATVYRFTEHSVRRALDAGWGAADLHAFVAACSRTPVPQPLTYLIDDVARRHGRLRVGVGESYVRSDDEAALAELAADTRAEVLQLRRLGPGVLVTHVPVDLLLARLREWGRSPVIEGPDGTTRRSTADARRTPVSRRRRLHAPATSRLTDADLAATVAAMRRGDHVATTRPANGAPPRPTATSLLAQLREAAESGASVRLAYVDQHGGRSERTVSPVRVEDGWVTALDRRSDTTLTLALHRVRDVARAD